MSGTIERARVRSHIAVPSDSDDKYSRGVLGFLTGSSRYPGAAAIGVEAALHTGVGMVRYIGPASPTALVLQRRPEAVPGWGRAQAWVVGSGWGATQVGSDPNDPDAAADLDRVLASGAPIVLDAGALTRWGEVAGSTVLTPHAGELARLLGCSRAEVEADRAEAVRRGAQLTEAVVLLKGAETLVVGPGDEMLRVRNATPWLATAGAGDALAGILGALLSAQPAAPDLTGIAASAAWVHGEAARRASNGGPFTVLQLCVEVSGVVADLVR